MHNTVSSSSIQLAARDDLDVAHYFSQLWQRRLLIGLAALAGLMADGVFVFTRPRQYDAEAPLVLTRTKFGEAVQDTSAVGNFIPFFENTSAATQVIKEFGLDGKPYDASPTTLFPDLVQVEEVRNSQVILIKGRFQDPKLAANVVNRVAHLGIDASQRANQQEAVQARDLIKVQRDEAERRLDDVNEQLRKYRLASQIELVHKDVDSALTERANLLSLSIDIESKKSQLAKAEEELAQRSQIDTVRRSIDADPALMEAARSAGAQNVLPLQLRDESVNPVYQKLDRDIATSRSELAGLEKQRQQLASRHLDKATLPGLNVMYDRESALKRLETEQDLAQKVYVQIATTYETAKLTVAARSSAIHLLSEAVVADRPIPRHVGQAVLLGAIVGSLIAILYVLSANALRALIRSSLEPNARG